MATETTNKTTKNKTSRVWYAEKSPRENFKNFLNQQVEISGLTKTDYLNKLNDKMKSNIPASTFRAWCQGLYMPKLVDAVTIAEYTQTDIYDILYNPKTIEVDE